MGETSAVADEYTLRVLEFEKIRERLAAHASWAGGRELALALQPVADPEEVCRRLDETGEGLALLEVEGFSLAGIRDVRRAVARAQVGATLDPAELLDVASTLSASRRLQNLLRENRQLVPRLATLAEQLVAFPELEKSITTAITPQAEVADNASPRLARIRRSLRLLQDRLRSQMESIIRSSQYLRWLQDPIITVREGRYVVPVKVEARAQVPGIIHDQSASGATLFIEPMVAVELNNELRRLSLEEKEEVARILGELSAAVGQYGSHLRLALEALAHLDMVIARAEYAQALEASRPELDAGGSLEFRGARHPLLGRQAVPIDVSLGDAFDTLVISGPNTGGKTVALKTVGLLTLMAQAGLYLPCSPGSRAGVFRRIFADIGDEQSIEQNLSTFSSHMRNIVNTVRHAGPGTMVLLDELGAGTDPAQGAALGMAILDYLQESGCRTVVTTHSGELKSYAYTHPRVESAAVEFDPVTLEPSYRLQVGTPGFSNAFAIAARLGLPSSLVEKARSLMSPDQQQVEALLAGLARDRQLAAEERERARRAAAEAERARADAIGELAEVRARQEEMLARARTQAQRIADEARRELETVSRAVRRAQKEEDRLQREAALREAREALRRLRTEAEAIPAHGRVAAAPAAHEGVARAGVPAAGGRQREPEKLLPGTRVRVYSMGREGYLLSAPDRSGRVEVQVGILRTSVPAADVIPAEEPVQQGTAGTGPGAMMMHKAQEVSPEVHVRGLTVDEALEVLGKYIDDAVLAGLKTARVIHGKGTGTLRRAVAEYLRQHPQVENFHLADQAEGGEGATVITLK